MRHLLLLFALLVPVQVRSKPPAPITVAAGGVTDSTVARTLRSARTPPGTALEWTVTAAEGDVSTWTGLPSGQVVGADTLALAVTNTSWDGDSTRFCAEVWNRKGTQRSLDSQRLCWWERRPVQPLPAPGPITVDTTTSPTPEPTPTPAPDTTGEPWLFVDTFDNGTKAPANAYFSWTGTNGVPPTVVPFAGSPSGWALRFQYTGNPNTCESCDAFSEQNYRLPTPTDELFVCMKYAVPGNYFHRNATGPDNNKGFRVWGGPTLTAGRDSSYRYAATKAGYSTIAYDTAHARHGQSQMIIEFGSLDATGSGNYGAGPWAYAEKQPDGTTKVFTWFIKGTTETIGFYAKAATKNGTTGNSNMYGADGIIRVWKNGQLWIDKTDLDTYTPNAVNQFMYGYLLGWSNSGFTETTDVHLIWFGVARQPVASCAGG